MDHSHHRLNFNLGKKIEIYPRSKKEHLKINKTAGWSQNVV